MKGTMTMLEKLEVKTWLELNAKLQQKKNALRKMLKEKGVLKKEGENTFDRYKYFSEAQYKQLFTELLSAAHLELKFTEIEYGLFEGSEKQANGRMPKIEFTLFDCETGFYETTTITGEAVDKGDKAGYKAYTGALKYYLADTFLVATGDDPEKESPEQKIGAEQKVEKAEKKASANQIEIISGLYEGRIPEMLEHYKLEKIEDMPMALASKIIASKAKKEESK